jgi:hypothetical protein
MPEMPQNLLESGSRGPDPFMSVMGYIQKLQLKPCEVVIEPDRRESLKTITELESSIKGLLKSWERDTTYIDIVPVTIQKMEFSRFTRSLISGLFQSMVRDRQVAIIVEEGMGIDKIQPWRVGLWPEADVCKEYSPAIFFPQNFSELKQNKAKGLTAIAQAIVAVSALDMAMSASKLTKHTLPQTRPGQMINMIYRYPKRQIEYLK